MAARLSTPRRPSRITGRRVGTAGGRRSPRLARPSTWPTSARRSTLRHVPRRGRSRAVYTTPVRRVDDGGSTRALTLRPRLRRAHRPRPTCPCPHTRPVAAQDGRSRRAVADRRRRRRLDAADGSRRRRARAAVRPRVRRRRLAYHDARRPEPRPAADTDLRRTDLHRSGLSHRGRRLAHVRAGIPMAGVDVPAPTSTPPSPRPPTGCRCC